jgi:hypothetical protein
MIFFVEVWFMYVPAPWFLTLVQYWHLGLLHLVHFHVRPPLKLNVLFAFDLLHDRQCKEYLVTEM